MNQQQTTHYRGWQLTTYPGRPWVGCAKMDRSPFDVILLKGFSNAELMAALRRHVDEIEDGDVAGHAQGSGRGRPR
jgi:hypothetical protein